MDLEFTKQDQCFREEVRDWLNANIPRTPRPEEGAAMREFDTSWQRIQYEGGWAGISWPVEYGGRGLSLVQQLIWYEEYARAKAPVVGCMFMALNHGGPTIIVKGTEEQKRKHLPAILRGEHVWCQGFSEPGAGSDLAGLRTRAVIDGDCLVVNGSKIWTTFGSVADFQELLVRTDATGPKHHGITWVIADMHAPGITIKPISTLSHNRHFSEVFYDDVRIPLSNVVGAVDDGWNVAMTTLGFERGSAAIAHQIELARTLEDIIEIAGTRTGANGQPLIANQNLADQLATLRAEVAAVRAMTYLNVSRGLHEQVPGPKGTFISLFHMELVQRVHRLSLEVIGADSLELSDDSGWTKPYLDAIRYTIAGGTSEIRRNIIAERILGLPKQR